MEDNEVLVLVPLRNDLTDFNGIQYPTLGKVVCNNFTCDKELSDGLYGSLWGRFSTCAWFDSNHPLWAVVKVRRDINLILADKNPEIVKFRQGEVKLVDYHPACANYIYHRINEEINLADISHVQLESQDIYDHVILNGTDAEGTSKHCNTHILMTGTGSKATSLDIESHAIVTGTKSQALAVDEMSHAIALNCLSRAKACGSQCVAFTIGIQSEALSLGYDGISISLGTSGLFAVGEGGVAIFAWDDGDRQRFKVVYAGEDIDSNTMYEFKDGKIKKAGV